MPASSASRGDVKLTGLPSTRYSPLVGLCTPENVLMRVDFPAPLSPSRHMTSPARTDIETPDRAMTEPKCLTILRTSMSGDRSVAIVMIALPSLSLADEVVEQHGEQEHRAEEHLEPVAIERV